MNLFPAVNVTLGPAILVFPLQDFNFQDPSLAERVVALTARELSQGSNFSFHSLRFIPA